MQQHRAALALVPTARRGCRCGAGTSNGCGCGAGAARRPLASPAGGDAPVACAAGISGTQGLRAAFAAAGVGSSSARSGVSLRATHLTPHSAVASVANIRKLPSERRYTACCPNQASAGSFSSKCLTILESAEPDRRVGGRG